MALKGDVFSWGRNIEGQLGDDTTISTFTSAATAYPVGGSGRNVSDDFTGTNGNPPNPVKWTITSGSPEIQGNRLRVQCVSTTRDDIVELKRIGQGDFEVKVSWEIDSAITTNSYFMRLQAYSDVNNSIGIYRAYLASIQMLIADATESGSYSSDWDNVGTATSGTFKITRVGSETRTFYEIGSGWVELGSHLPSSWNIGTDDVTIILSLTNSSSNPSQGGYFDNFSYYEDGGASDNFEIFNIARDEEIRGVTTSIPSSAARWVLTGEANNGNDLFVVEDNKLKWDGTGDIATYTYGTLASNFRLEQYRWLAITNFKIEIDWDLLTWQQPGTSQNDARLLIWVSSAAFIIVGRRYTSGGTDETYVQGSSTGVTSWVGAGTNQTSGKFKIEYPAGTADLTVYGWNETAQQWEWDGNPAGLVMTEDVVAPVFIIQNIQQVGGGMNVEWSNLNVIGEVPYGHSLVNPPIPTPGFAYWEQPQSRFAGAPFLEFSGDTPGTTANNITRQYRTYDGSIDTIGPFIEGVTLPLWTVAGGNLYFDGITNNPNGARDLHPLLIFENDFEIIWETNIISAPNTCCWSVRLSCYQFGPVRGTSLMSYEPEYGYSGSRRYRVYKDPGTGGAWQNSTGRTDAVIRIKIIHRGNDWESWGWWNGIWNQLGSSMTQTSTHGPTILTMRFSNWSVWPGFQADWESLTIVPSGTPDGSFYWADAPYVPSPSGYTDESAILIGDPQFEDMAGGVNHAIGLKEDGSAFAWGDNQYGQLGDGTLVNKSSPVSVQGNHSFSELAPASDHNLALDAEGNLFSWGRNDFGQLGSLVVSGSDQDSPISIAGTFITASTGLDHSLAIDRDMQVWAWGRNANGQLGTGDTTNKDTPTLVSGLPAENFIKVTGGAKHSCAMTEFGDVWCWGSNEFGQTAGPVQQTGAIGAGSRMAAAVDTDGRMWMWGLNEQGQLGDNSRTDRSLPVSVVGSPTWLSTSTPPASAGENPCHGIPVGLCTGCGEMGDNTSWAIRDEGIDGVTGERETSVWTWGYGFSGQLGNGSFGVSVSSPVSVLGSRNWRYWNCSSSANHMCCIDRFWKVWCWGESGSGECGLNYPGSPTKYSSPTNLDTAMFDHFPGNNFLANHFKKVSTGANFTVFLDTGGRGFVTGANNSGGRLMLGYTGGGELSPVQVIGPPAATAWIDCAAGGNNSFWIDTEGNVYGAGSDGNGMAGYNVGVAQQASPNLVAGSPHSAIKVHTAWEQYQVGGFLRADGSLWMWGNNDFGMLGVGDMGAATSRTSPTSVLGSGDLYRFVDFSIGAEAVVAIDDTGQAWGWGKGDRSGLGGANRSSPEIISTLSPFSPEIWQAPSLAASGAIDLDAGGYHNIILKDDKAWGWGSNHLGQLGDNSLTDKFAPVSAYTTHKFVDISAGEQHSWAMKADGTICTWGAGDWGKLLWNEDENPRSTPVCGTIEGIACIPFLPSTGNFAHSTFMQCGSQFIAWTWGCNTDGKLGDGSISNRSTPVQVIGNKRWIDMSGGGDFTIAIDTDGHIYAWGDDSLGQLGDG